MRRFEFSEGSSNKFWEIDHGGGESFTVRWGKLGTEGQSQTKSFDTSARAAAAAEKLIAEKLGKGYHEAGSAAAARPTAVVAPAPQSAPAPKSASVPTAVATLPPPATPREGPARMAWTEALRRKIHPWRGMSGVPKPSTEIKKATARLAEVAALSAVDLAAKAGRRGVEVKQRAALPPDHPAESSQVEATYAALLGFNDAAWPRANELGADIVAIWCVRRGVLYALETLIAVFPLNPNGDAGRDRKGWGSVPFPGPWQVLRSHLAAASPADYAAALELARPHVESGDPELRMMLAYAFPDQPSWAERAARELLAAGSNLQAGCTLLASLLDPDLAAQIARKYENFVAAEYVEIDAADYLMAMVDRLGEAAVGPLSGLLAAASKANAKRAVCQALGAIASRPAAELLLTLWGDKAVGGQVTAWFTSQPYLAALLLTPRACSSRDESFQSCLRAALAADPQEAARALPDLDPGARAWLEAAGVGVGPSAAAAASPPVPAAALGELPPVLASPPWLNPRPKVKARVVEGLQIPADYPEQVVWRKGERKPDGRPHGRFGAAKEAEMLKGLRSDPTGVNYLKFADHLLELSDSEGALQAWNEIPGTFWNPYGLRGSSSANTAQLQFLARFDTRCLPGLLATLSVAPDQTFEAFTRVDSPRIAMAWAEALQGKKNRALAQRWLQEFPRAAAVGLIPTALGAAGKTRHKAEEALRFVARTHREVVVSAASEYGQAAREGVEELLAYDPLYNLPARLPARPAWFSPAIVRSPQLKNSGALPGEALEHLATMLALSQLDEPYAGLEQVREACTSASLEEFAWDVFSAWLRAGGPSKEDWGFIALGLLGGDDAARRLAPELRKWPGEGLSQRAQRGLDILGAIGTDIALMHLHGLSQKVKYKALQDKAQQKIEEIAESRGLTVDELADRLVPDLDLDEHGTRILSFGSRSFRVGFDEQLKPFVTDSDGKRLGDLPKALKSDDAAAADEATAIWKALKKDVKAIASLQVERLELSMARRRRWEAGTFQLFLAGHPLLIHLVRRLVWGVYTEGRLAATFRVTEDRSLADRDDAAFSLPEQALVGIVHPLDLTEAELAPWRQLFSDYELLQPFAQLARPVHRPTPAEAKADRITRMNGRSVGPGRILRLERRGWHRGYVESGCITEFVKALGESREACLDVPEGVYVLEPGDREVTLGDVRLSSGRVADLDPVEFSEILLDLESL